jgi:protein ImuB
MLWACLYFPQLPINRQGKAEAPTAVIAQHRPRKVIMACNDVAESLGIHCGLALNSAYAIAPDLHVNDYIEEDQRTHLHQIALWAMAYSSWVTPRMPASVLLEIKSSLKLFGGLDALLHLLKEGCAAQGLDVQVGVAPTSIAAALFAYAGISEPARTKKAMNNKLADIPVAYLTLDDFTLRSLRSSGIKRLQQLIDIPPAALTRRFGHQCTDLIYKLNGTLPDPCPAFIAPDTFSQAFDLALEAPDTQALTFPLNRLLSALGGYLKTGDRGVKSLDITMYHFRSAPTIVPIRFLSATADHAHLLKVAKERLANTVLAEPVTRLKIHATELADIERDGKDLFQKSQAQSHSIQQVFENLMARLGKDQLYTAMPDEDHRPEKAWLAAMLESKQAPSAWPARPLWLLPEPRPASEPLELLTYPERIENGWWGNCDVRRDYSIAHNATGSYFWVFTLRNEPSVLYIHGIFA